MEGFYILSAIAVSVSMLLLCYLGHISSPYRKWKREVRTLAKERGIDDWKQKERLLKAELGKSLREHFNSNVTPESLVSKHHFIKF